VVTLAGGAGLGLLRRDGARVGLAWDLRRAALRGYSELDFEIPIGKNGDCYDRYLCRIEEMRESVKIMQAVHREDAGEGPGPVMPEHSQVRAAARGEMKRSMEALIHHFKLYTEGFHVPAGEVYAASKRPRASSASIW
jgi:NADH-quinone oxidoreductase subunit D